MNPFKRAKNHHLVQSELIKTGSPLNPFGSGLTPQAHPFSVLDSRRNVACRFFLFFVCPVWPPDFYFSPAQRIRNCKTPEDFEF